MLQDTAIDAISAGGPFRCPPHSKYEKLILLAKEVPPATTMVVHPCEESLAERPPRGRGFGLNQAHSGRPEDQIIAVAKEHGIDVARCGLVVRTAMRPPTPSLRPLSRPLLRSHRLPPAGVALEAAAGTSLSPTC